MAGTIRAQYLGPARRRPIVLQVALEAFAELGYAASSMSAIAARSGISKPVLYDCFPDGKPEILRRLMEDAARRLDQRIAASNRPSPAGSLTALLAFAADNSGHARLLFDGVPGTEAARRRAVRAVARAAGMRIRSAGESLATLDELIAAVVRASTAGRREATAILAATSQEWLQAASERRSA